MHIQADTAHLDGVTNTKTLNGNVVVTQGTTTVLADKLVLLTDKQNKIIEAIATGQYASYSTLTEVNKPILHALAQTIQYYPPSGQVILIGQAHVTQGSNTFSAPRIEYNMNDQTVATPASQLGRTTIVIQPQSATQTSTPNSGSSSTPINQPSSAISTPAATTAQSNKSTL
jgi:lipopolysaccharide export system protein LptA